jgi:hypothetical protein
MGGNASIVQREIKAFDVAQTLCLMLQRVKSARTNMSGRHFSAFVIACAVQERLKLIAHEAP